MYLNRREGKGGVRLKLARPQPRPMRCRRARGLVLVVPVRARNLLIEQQRPALGGEPDVIEAQRRRDGAILQGGSEFVREVDQPVADIGPVLAPIEKLTQRLSPRRVESVPVPLRA